MVYCHSDFDYVDSHVHLFPPKLFNAIWNFFERRDENNQIHGWEIKYKLKPDEMVKFLEQQNVKYFTTYNYAHKEGIAEMINEWIHKFSQKYQNSIPFGCVWPGDENKTEYMTKIFHEFKFKGIKIQPLVQNFFLNDDRMDEVYKIIIEEGKWINIHAGTAPYKNKFVGYKNFVPFIKKYPNIQVIVAHMGAFEYRKFINLVDHYENLYLDTTMIFIPNNVFPERTVRQPPKEELLSYQDRILFGSDFPNIPYEYRNSTKGLLDFDFPKSFYKKVFYENAHDLFQLKPPRPKGRGFPRVH